MKKNSNIRIVCIALFAGLAIAALSGCKNPAAPSGEAKLLSFTFEKRFNPWLDNDIAGVIDEGAKTVTVRVPQNAYRPSPGMPDKKFKPSFTVSPKAALYKGTREQKSGITEDLFIQNRKYRVKAEDGSSTEYALRINIVYDTPSVPSSDAETVKQFYGTYRGLLHFDNNEYKIYVVVDGEKVSFYSGPMSSVYINTDWEKDSESNWVCRTYHRGNFERKRTIEIAGETVVQVKATATFKTVDGKVTCKLVVDAMKDKDGNIACSKKDMEKGTAYVFKPGDGEGFSAPQWQ